MSPLVEEAAPDRKRQSLAVLGFQRGATTVNSRARQPERSTCWQERKSRRSRVKQILTSCSTPVSYTHLDVYKRQVRARAGVAFDRFMPYITGGWAYGNVKSSIPAIGFSSDRSHTGGFAVGGGLEYAVTNNIIAGVEYLYVDLGEKNILGANTCLLYTSRCV